MQHVKSEWFIALLHHVQAYLLPHFFPLLLIFFICFRVLLDLAGVKVQFFLHISVSSWAFSRVFTFLLNFEIMIMKLI